MTYETLIRIPQAPDYRVPWSELQVFPWVQKLEECPQDPIHHAEGNVWIHTEMVLNTLSTMAEWRQLPEEEQRIVYLGCLLHDVAKPVTTKVEDDGRVTARGHSRRGEIMARKILWELGLPFQQREQVCGLIRFHQIPFYLIERDDAQRLAAEISLVTRCDWLAMVAEADIRGRHCQDMQRILDNIEMFRTYCQEENCYQQPRSFASEHTRFRFFGSTGKQPDIEVFDDTRCCARVMCGLPGSGKDTYLAQNFPKLPMVSLDGIRQELGLEPGSTFGTVFQMARERVREHLRAGRDFAWNSTNLSRQLREPLLSLLADYHARIEIIYVEAPRSSLFRNNKDRAERAVVPEKRIWEMMDKWEIPDLTEAHQVHKIIHKN
jgi:putative nucleotidyltransferase with HDIG domain